MSRLDAQATRFLARHAFLAKAISPIDFEFLLDEPDRFEEVVEFTTWLAGGAS